MKASSNRNGRNIRGGRTGKRAGAFSFPFPGAAASLILLASAVLLVMGDATLIASVESQPTQVLVTYSPTPTTTATRTATPAPSPSSTATTISATVASTPTAASSKTATAIPSAPAVTQVVAAAQPTPSGSVSPPRIQTADGRQAAAGRIIVGYRDGTNAAERQDVRQKAAARAGVAAAATAKSLGQRAELVEVASSLSLEEAIKAYVADPRVLYAQPDYAVSAVGTPNDSSFSSQWGMRLISAPAAWDQTHGSSSVKVAVVDSGVDLTHPDLASKIAGAANCITGGSCDPSVSAADGYGHGTHVAGIVAAATNNGEGVAGVGYDTSLLIAKVLDDTGAGYVSYVLRGIQWGTLSGAKVVNLSLANTQPSGCDPAMQQAIDDAYAAGAVVVAAAGNSGSNATFSPAVCNHVVSVASVDYNDGRSYFSNYGSWVKVAAPGGSDQYGNGILSTSNVGGYISQKGTSMAAPHVSGLAALVWATSWGTSAQAVMDRIFQTADRIAGTGSSWQYGRINAAAAVAPLPGPVVQRIALHSGWNWFSIAVWPANTSPSAVLASISGSYDYVLDNTGTYAPSGPAGANNLSSIVPGKAYMIRMTAPAELSISGSNVAATAVPLAPGWNWVGYLGQASQQLPGALSAVSGQFDYVLGEYGVYSPSQTLAFLNTLHQMDPGKGYMIKMRGAASLTYGP